MDTCHYLNFLCSQNEKFIGLISIIEVSATKMMTRGTHGTFIDHLTRVHVTPIIW
jgi:hypothetical protein